MMAPSPAQLDEAFEAYAEASERPRYTKGERPNDWPRTRRKKLQPWRMEGIYVSREVWMEFADEGCKQYAGGHGSRRLWVVFFNGEEVGKFPTQTRAKEFIWDKERT